MIYYNSWDNKCKQPFGAAVEGDTVKFTVFSDSCTEGYLCIDDKEIKLEKNGNFFSAQVSLFKAGLKFYHFKMITNNLFTVYIGKGNDDNFSFSLEKPETRYQITVTKKMPPLPNWYTNGIIYQIFPDRFCRSGEVLNPKKNCYIYENWNQIPSYIKNSNGEIEKWDFFGGNLKGIESKLDYLKLLNVSVIYLNPIFEASSNHRYNTADFSKIDPMLGTYDDFISLVKKADEMGIKIILDGVFNHVGADSIYFNKFSNYNSKGAYNSCESEYSDWFTFEEYPDKYLDWWGVSDLPKLNTENSSVRDFIINNDDSVIKKWMKTGIGGFRLDVADELSDSFLYDLNKTAKAENENSVILGEVWEDASNKISYGVRKSYFTYPELDCVMNYPIRDNLISFFKREINAKQLKNLFMTQLENYPERNYMGNFNLISSHDVERILTVCKNISKDGYLNIFRQFVAALFIFAGVPCIYYGDEAGLEGGKDPDNRRTFPWGNENMEIYNIYKEYSDLRNSGYVLKKGSSLFENAGEDVLCLRRSRNNSSVILYLNRSTAPVSFICPFTKENIYLERFSHLHKIF